MRSCVLLDSLETSSLLSHTGTILVLSAMSSSHLCGHCSQIDFSSLTHPTLADVRNAQRGRRKGTRSASTKLLPQAAQRDPEPAAEPLQVDLGSFDRIEESSRRCQLCSIIADTIRRQGEYPSTNADILRGDEIHFWADPDTSYYGYVTDSLMDGDTSWSDSYFIVRRLHLRVRAQNETWDRAFFNHFVQPCNVYLPADPMPSCSSDTMKESGEMIFCGRKRPLILDIRLLQRWIKICTDDHHLSCGVGDDALDNA